MTEIIEYSRLTKLALFIQAVALIMHWRLDQDAAAGVALAGVAIEWWLISPRIVVSQNGIAVLIPFLPRRSTDASTVTASGTMFTVALSSLAVKFRVSFFMPLVCRRADVALLNFRQQSPIRWAAYSQRTRDVYRLITTAAFMFASVLLLLPRV